MAVRTLPRCASPLRAATSPSPGGSSVRGPRVCSTHSRTMFAARSLALLLALSLAAAAAAAATPNHVRVRRQLADDNTLQPLDGAEGEEQTREKRKFEAATQAKFGIKNAVLGFVFGSGTTWRRRATKGAPRALGATKRQATEGASSSLSNTRPLRQVATTTDSIPVFDRNKVSLDFPGNLFGPSVSLLIRSTKVIGDVIQNSAVRYQSFLRLFRPLFRGPFEIKGLDPPTTTTTTTTTTAKPPASNGVRRRRNPPVSS